MRDLVESCNIDMVINVGKVLEEYLKGSILDLVECYLCLRDTYFLFQ